MASKKRRQFQQILHENELNANWQMAKVCAFGAFVLAIVWVAYLAHWFPLYDYTLVNVFIPIDIVLLLIPLAIKRTKFFVHPVFKYFLLFGFLAVIGVLNIIIPKHGILGYALIIVLAGHYYSTKLGRIMFVATLITMFVCLYGGMFVGEYDTNLLGAGMLSVDETGKAVLYEPQSPAERYEYLKYRLENGRNRFVEVFLYYYLSRALILSLIFLASHALEKRTFNLLKSESENRKQKERMQTELGIAHDIQLNALPRPFQNNDDVEILAELIPAKEVGGDFYDYVILDSNHVAVLIGDVAGKGVPGAMVMMKTVTCFQNFIRPGKDPAKIMAEVNAALSRNNESATFVTCFFGILDTQTGLLTFCNAGHNPPVIRAGKRAFFLPTSRMMPLGSGDLAAYHNEQFRLKKGDMIALYTDGLTEARNAQGGFYGNEALLSFFSKSDFSSLMQLHYELRDEMLNFIGTAEQADDLTYLFLQYQGDKISIFEMEVPAETGQVQKLLDLVREKTTLYGIKKPVTAALLLVVDEIFSNIAKYAYDNKTEDPTVYFRFQYNVDKKEVVLVFVDKGIHFNMLGVEKDPLSQQTYASAEQGGLGILLVKKQMDDCSYSRLWDKNVLILKKKVQISNGKEPQN